MQEIRMELIVADFMHKNRRKKSEENKMSIFDENGYCEYSEIR